MPPRLPAKPRTSPLITRTLVAMALGAPACGTILQPPNRIGPPPMRIGPPPPPMRIGPPSCVTGPVTVGIVFVGERREALANQPVTLSIRGEERIVTTDQFGQFKLTGMEGYVDETLTAKVPGYDTVDIGGGGSRCDGPSRLEVLLKPAGSPDIPRLENRGTIIHD